MKKQTKVHICECGGRILPKYRKNKKPTYKCNKCNAPYTPKER